MNKIPRPPGQSFRQETEIKSRLTFILSSESVSYRTGNTTAAKIRTMLVAVLILVVLILGTVKYRSLFKGFENVDKMFPGPPSWPFIGDALEFWDQRKAFHTGVRLVLLYRRSFRLWMGPIPYIMIVSPSDVEVVLNNMNLLEKSDFYDFLLPWIGRGLLTSYGNRWKKHRKALTPAFHFKILDGFLDVFNENAKVMCEILQSEVGGNGFDAMYYMKLCALDNICETAMGTSIDAQHNPHSDYVKSIRAQCEIAFKRTLSPWLRPDWLFALTHHGRTQKKSLEIIHNLTRSVIEARVEIRKETGPGVEVQDSQNEQQSEQNAYGMKKRRAFLDLLLDLTDEGTLTIQDVVQEVDTFMFEGHDTITSALSYITHNLSKYPKYQKLAYEEQVEIFGNDTRPPTNQDLQDMKYLERFIKETLRLFSSVPVIGRRVTEDIQLNPWAIVPKGAQIILGTVGIHRNPDVWERPVEFYPDHFLPEASLKRHPFAYVPFSAGPRNCIGMRFAMMEMKATISLLLRRFEIHPANPPVDTFTTVETVTGSRTGFQVSIKPRNK